MGYRWPQSLLTAREAPIPNVMSRSVLVGAVSNRTGRWSGNAPDARDGGGRRRLFQLRAPGGTRRQRRAGVSAHPARALVRAPMFAWLSCRPMVGPPMSCVGRTRVARWSGPSTNTNGRLIPLHSIFSAGDQGDVGIYRVGAAARAAANYARVVGRAAGSAIFYRGRRWRAGLCQLHAWYVPPELYRAGSGQLRRCQAVLTQLHAAFLREVAGKRNARAALAFRRWHGDPRLVSVAAGL